MIAPLARSIPSINMRYQTDTTHTAVNLKRRLFRLSNSRAVDQVQIKHLLKLEKIRFEKLMIGCSQDYKLDCVLNMKYVVVLEKGAYFFKIFKQYYDIPLKCI